MNILEEARIYGLSSKNRASTLVDAMLYAMERGVQVKVKNTKIGSVEFVGLSVRGDDGTETDYLISRDRLKPTTNPDLVLAQDILNLVDVMHRIGAGTWPLD